MFPCGKSYPCTILLFILLPSWGCRPGRNLLAFEAMPVLLQTLISYCYVRKYNNPPLCGGKKIASLTLLVESSSELLDVPISEN